MRPFEPEEGETVEDLDRSWGELLRSEESWSKKISKKIRE